MWMMPRNFHPLPTRSSIVGVIEHQKYRMHFVFRSIRSEFYSSLTGRITQPRWVMSRVTLAVLIHGVVLGNIEWEDKTKRRCLVLWKSPEEWAKTIYQWVMIGELPVDWSVMVGLISGYIARHEWNRLYILRTFTRWWHAFSRYNFANAESFRSWWRFSAV